MAKRRISVEEAKNLIVDYLRENGSANINELYRAIGCGKQTIYDAINHLNSEGKIKNVLSGNRRMISLRENIPVYLKVLTGLTLMCILVATAQPQGLQDIVTVSLYTGGVVTEYRQPSLLSVITLFTALILTGYWFAVFTLKWVDFADSVHITKNRFKVLFEKIGLKEHLKLK